MLLRNQEVLGKPQDSLFIAALLIALTKNYLECCDTSTWIKLIQLLFICYGTSLKTSPVDLGSLNAMFLTVLHSNEFRFVFRHDYGVNENTGQIL